MKTSDAENRLLLTVADDSSLSTVEIDSSSLGDSFSCGQVYWFENLSNVQGVLRFNHNSNYILDPDVQGFYKNKNIVLFLPLFFFFSFFSFFACTKGATHLRKWFILNPRGPVADRTHNITEPELQAHVNKTRCCFLKDIALAIQSKNDLQPTVFCSVSKTGLHSRQKCACRSRDHAPQCNARSETVGTMDVIDSTGTLHGLELTTKDVEQLM